ncbi:TIGR04282 family arsenosugar biosynthesis glycosyltransferase [Algoriphagus sp. AGSA1]|nr:TIGR04282 family arsenosugar biosynthesis glycosyltransferase [Algoriphagus sp. AGSA1]MCE7056718.1 TIGR04282 family arsenosugar biosynthesis glycosyltransferase [Algoriphagus sp. AGSA1]
MKDAVLIFQKNTQLGKVKTRLAAAIGDQAALHAYELLVKYTHRVASRLKAQKILWFSDYMEEDLSSYPKNYRFELQSGSGLGEKMSNAFQKLFTENFDRLLIIGTDCAELTPELLDTAFKELEENDVVIGPALDGGYYLLGMRKFIPGIFQGIPWSTDQVAALTKDYLSRNGYSYSQLKPLSDVDVIEDWNQVKGKLKS